MPQPKRFELELTESERDILKAVVQSSLTAGGTLASRAKKPVEALSKREREVLEKAASILASSGDVSTLKLSAGQLTLLEETLRKGSQQLEKHSGLVQETGRLARTAARRVVHPFIGALQRQVPDIEADPSAANSLAKQLQGLHGRLKRFRESVEIHISFGEPKGRSGREK